MPSSKNYVRDHAQERKTALARGDRPKNISRKRARRLYESKYGPCGGDIAHKDGNAMNNNPANLRCMSPTKNRSYARTKTAGKRDPKS
jgi:hypothetical protein